MLEASYLAIWNKREVGLIQLHNLYNAKKRQKKKDRGLESSRHTPCAVLGAVSAADTFRSRELLADGTPVRKMPSK
jgi:hypothetical protein